MTTTGKRNDRRGATLGIALAIGLAGAGCGIETEELGNVLGDCPAGTTCSCGTGNCVMACPGGGCDFQCGGASNCTFDCAGGGCTADCHNTGNCFLACSGDGCDLTCTNVGNCGLTECTTDCVVTCANTGTCF